LVPAVSAAVLETPAPAEAPAGRPAVRLTAADVYRLYSRPDGTLIREALLTRDEACLVLRLTTVDGAPNASRLYQLRHGAGLRASRRGTTLLFRLGDLLDFCAPEVEEPYLASVPHRGRAGR